MVGDNIQRGQDVKISSPSLPRFAVSVISRRWCCKVFYGAHWSHLLADSTMLWAFEHPDLKRIAHIEFLLDFSDGGKSREWAEAEIERTRESCDFCKPYKFTVALNISMITPSNYDCGTHFKDFDEIQLKLSVQAKEPWGRIKAPGCVSAANVFKVLPLTIIIIVRIVSKTFPRLPVQATAWSYPALTIFLTSGNLKWISCFIVPNCGW